MKFMMLLTLSMLLILTGCETTKPTGDDASKDSIAAPANTLDDCAIPELSGKSCVEPDLDEIAKHPFGISAKNPVRTDGPKGQREYISRLICPGGNPVSNFNRAGSIGVGPYGFIMDAYKIVCTTGEQQAEYTIFIDMYHSGYIEKKPVEGFAIKN